MYPESLMCVGGGKQVVFTIQALTLGALLSARLYCIDTLVSVWSTGFYRKQAKLIGS